MSRIDQSIASAMQTMALKGLAYSALRVQVALTVYTDLVTRGVDLGGDAPTEDVLDRCFDLAWAAAERFARRAAEKSQ